MLKSRDDRIIHHSTYLTVPKEWLLEQFFIEAEHLKSVNEKAYRNEYMGEVTGTGSAVFSNSTLRETSDEEMKAFDLISRGLD